MQTTFSVAVLSVLSFVGGCERLKFADPPAQRLVCIQGEGKPFFDAQVTDISWYGDNVTFKAGGATTTLHVPAQVCAVTPVPPAPPAPEKTAVDAGPLAQ